MPALTPITALLTADIAQFRDSMAVASDLTDKFSMRVSAAAAAANSAFRQYEASAARAAAAQKELDDLQASGTATADEIAGAEAKVAEAQNAMASAGERAALAQERLMSAQRGQAAAATESAAASEKGGRVMGLLGNGYVLAGAAALDMGYKAVKSAGDFQSAMELIHTSAGVPQNQIDSLSKGVLNLAGKVGFDPGNLADALYHVESSFATMPQVLNASGGALGVLETAAKGAAIGHSDLTATTDALDAAIASGIPGVQNASQTMAVLNAVVGSGDMKMQDLAKAFSTGVTEEVKLFGANINDLGAGLALFGDNIQRAQKAGTLLRMTFQDIAMPSQSKVGVQTLKDLHLTAKELTDTLSNKGIVSTIQLIIDKMKAAHIPAKQYGDELTKAFGRRAGTGIAEMVDQLDRLKSKYPAIKAGVKNFDDAWQQTEKTFNQKVKEMESGLKALEIEVGTKLIAAGEAAVKWVINFVKSIEDWYNKQVILKNAVSDAGKTIENDFIKPVQQTYNWVKGQLTPAINDLRGEIEKHPKVVKAVELAFGYMLGIMVKVWSFIDSSLIKIIAVSLVDAIEAGIGQIENIIKFFQKIIDIAGRVVSAVQGIINTISRMPSGALGAAAGLLGFDEGGFVPGPKGAPQLAIVHGGEYVVSNDMMARGSLPSSDFPGYSRGAAGVGSSGGGGGVPQVTNIIYLDGKQIAPSVQKQHLRYNKRNSTNGLALLAG